MANDIYQHIDHQNWNLACDWLIIIEDNLATKYVLVLLSWHLKIILELNLSETKVCYLGEI